MKLVEAGVLREMTGRPTNRVYAADEILGLLDALPPAGETAVVEEPS